MVTRTSTGRWPVEVTVVRQSPQTTVLQSPQATVRQSRRPWFNWLSDRLSVGNMHAVALNA